MFPVLIFRSTLLGEKVSGGKVLLSTSFRAIFTDGTEKFRVVRKLIPYSFAEEMLDEGEGYGDEVATDFANPLYRVDWGKSKTWTVVNHDNNLKAEYNAA